MHIGPSMYRYKGLYDLREVNTKLMELEERYGGIFYKARKYAGVLDKDFSFDVISRIIGLIQEYGEERVDKAIRKILCMRRDNPKRKIEYLIGILRSRREIDIPSE